MAPGCKKPVGLNNLWEKTKFAGMCTSAGTNTNQWLLYPNRFEDSSRKSGLILSNLRVPSTLTTHRGRVGQRDYSHSAQRLIQLIYYLASSPKGNALLPPTASYLFCSRVC